MDLAVPTSDRNYGSQSHGGLAHRGQASLCLRTQVGWLPFCFVVRTRAPTGLAESEATASLFPGVDRRPRPASEGTVVDGEVVVVIDNVTDFDALQQRVHPAASRIKMLSAQTPSQLVAFDLLALRGEDLRTRPFAERRERLVELAAGLGDFWNLTPSTTDKTPPRRGSMSSSRPAVTGSSPNNSTCRTSTASGR